MLDQLLASTELETFRADNCGEGVNEGSVVLENDASNDQNVHSEELLTDFTSRNAHADFPLPFIAATSDADLPNPTFDTSFQPEGAWSLGAPLTFPLFGDALPLERSIDVLNVSSSSISVPINNLISNSTAEPSSALSMMPNMDQLSSFQESMLVTQALPDMHATQENHLSGVIESLRGLTLAQKHQVMALLEVEIDHAKAQGQNRSAPSPTAHSPSKAAFNALIQIKTKARGYESWLSGVLASNLLSLPDPKLNSIRIIQSSFYAAILANSITIGLFNYEVLDEDGLSPYNIDHETGYPPNEVASARARFAARTPQSLAPSDGQLTFPHHPYLDVIPFGEFRQRAMAALSCIPPLFGEEELCHDFDAEGLVCWGSQPADAGRRGIETEVPWDPRSWEPQAWFLKKYWFLVGGLSGEMHTCAKLWADRRGRAI